MDDRVGSQLWTDNRLTSRLGVQYPIIQGPLGGLSSQRLTASVSNYGGLGSFGAHGLKPEAIRNVIREIKALTPMPFAMNLWVSMEDEGAVTSTEKAFHRSLAPLAEHIESVGGAKPTYLPYEVIRFEDQVQALLDEGISVFSFIYGIPSKQILDEFRRQGIALIGTATTVDEAIALEQAGVDAIAASGFEAGGHRGSFLHSSEDSLMGTMALVPQVVDAVRLPVVAAGELETRAELWQSSPSEPKACRWEPRSSRARSRERMRFIVRRSSAVKLSRLLLLAGSPEDLGGASKTDCSTNSTKRM